jgi:SAM-dependent methyltransferase
MDRNYYRQYYEFERNHWWFRVRSVIIFTSIKQVIEKYKFRSPKILNIGAATGYTSEILSGLGTVMSVEDNKECFGFLISLGKIDCVNASITELPFDNSTFDIVCAFDVIEHVEDDRKAVSEMHRVCKEGGIICVTVPVYMSLWSEHDEINHHIRRYSKSTLLPLFVQSNMIYQSYFNTILFLLVYIFRKLMYRLSRLRKEKRKQLKSDFEFNNRALNFIFYYIFSIEAWLMKNFISLPFGVSFFLMVQTKPKHT